MINRAITRWAFATLLTVVAAIASAGTLTVTSPTEGKFLGATSTLTFNGKNANVQVTVKAVITGPVGSTTVSTTVTPAVNGEFSGSLPLNFSLTAAQGAYTIVVSATEPNNTYTPVTLHVQVDTKGPKMLEYSPAQNSFVKGNVNLFFKLLEANMKEWRVTVGGADIPNNTGTVETTINVPYDTTPLENDGPQNVSLTVKDQADNLLTFAIPLTVDRKKPVTTIQFPQANSAIRPRTDVNVIIDITDQFAGSVDMTGVDVIVQKTDGTLITRVARESWRNIGSSSWRWTGRLRYRATLPAQYKIVASALDKAGNVAVRQEVTIKPGG